MKIIIFSISSNGHTHAYLCRKLCRHLRKWHHAPFNNVKKAVACYLDEIIELGRTVLTQFVNTSLKRGEKGKKECRE